MIGSLAGRSAVVTGGASGIGEACARVLAERGAVVAIADIDRARGEAVAAAIGGRFVHMDVGAAESVESGAAECERLLGPVAIVVTSAGVLQRPLPPEELPLEVYDRVTAIDQRGTYLTAVAFGRRMALRGSGAIITIASIAGMRSMPLHAYAPAKAAVISITESLAAEWGRSGVRINAVSPGFTRTPALQQAIDKGERDPTALEQNAALGRLVEPLEIAKVVAFLASDEASAMTGANVPVDCGWLAAPSWHTYGGLRARRGN
ncbi:MAG: SDR family oxidoreductase [Alphaproteobacteria bacterium]|nr:SDR family oxidoreductase [Alphaproteobacteria bacterium]